MSALGRIFLVFGLVLAAGLLGLQVARRPTALAAALGVSTSPAGTGSVRTAGLALPPAAPVRDLASAPPRMAPSVALPSGNSKISLSSSAPAASKALVSGPGATRTYHDRNYKISFDYPANWQFTDKDHEISTFRLDARTADRKTLLRAVTALPDNPYPASTFTGAFVYLSVTPHSNQEKCAAQASADKPRKLDRSEIAGLSFVHGHEEQKTICTVERDEIYTTYRKGACYRFDLAMNNFCGGEVSGVKDVTEQELDTVRTRMESIIGTVRFDPK